MLFIALVKDLSHMFDGCVALYWIDLSKFDTIATTNMEYMFYKCNDLGYINLNLLNDTNLIKYDNIFGGTPENMVFCFDKSNDKIYKQMVYKKCSEINCDRDWREIRKKSIASTGECTDACKRTYRFFYHYKCYERCPGKTVSVNLICQKEVKEYEEGDECDIKSYFENKCNLTLNTSLEKKKFIENTTKEILNAELYEIVLHSLEDKKVYKRVEENETYQIYALSNRYRDPDLAYVDLNSCGKLLKQKYNLKESQDVLVFKIEYRSPDFKIPIIEYVLFGRDASIKFNSNICKEEKILYYIPKKINDFKDYQYNPNNTYYIDPCTQNFFDSATDISIFDRQNEYNINNMSLCESDCTLLGYIHEQIVCDCKIKAKFNTYLNNIDSYNLIYRFNNVTLNTLNIWLFKCYYLLFQGKYLITNIGSYIILTIILITIICAIIFYFKEYDALKNDIKSIGYGKSGKFDFNDSKSDIIRKEFKETDDPKKINNIYNIRKNKKALTKNPKGTFKDSKNDDLISEITSKKNIINLDNKDDDLGFGIFDDDFKKKEKKTNSIKNKINDIDSLQIDNEAYISKNAKKTENEINYLKYDKALKLDKRTYCQIYKSLIKTNHIFLFTFYIKNDYNSRIIKVTYFFFIIALFLTVDMLFIEDSSFHHLFVTNGTFDILFYLPINAFSLVICFVLSKIFKVLFFTEMDAIQAKKKEGKEKIKKIQKILIKIGIKCILFFTIILVLLFVFWVYVSCFCAVFEKTQIFAIILTLISYGMFLILPFILSLIPPIFRILALKGNEMTTKNLCIYRLSQILQTLL